MLKPIGDPEINMTVEVKMSLNSRERVLAAINHEEPDRVPIILGGSVSTSIRMSTYQRLKKDIGILAEDRYLYERPELRVADLDERTLIRLRSDVRKVLDRLPSRTIIENPDSDLHRISIDSWGSGQIEIEQGVWFPGYFPLDNIKTIDEINDYTGWPDMDDPYRTALIKEQSAAIASENKYAIMGSPWLLFPLERAFALMGLERVLLNMATDPQLIKALLLKIVSYCKQLMGNFLRETGDNLDIVCIGDDLGTQDSLLMSPKMYRDILKPIHADYISFIKQRTKAKILFHSDGDIFPLIGDFIEIGVDILNPIQTSAGKMGNLTELKKQYGNEIVFCGAIDTHKILPLGRPEQVREEVKRVIQQLGPGGGFMLASVHTIMDDVPPENILAMVDAVEEYGKYPIH